MQADWDVPLLGHHFVPAAPKQKQAAFRVSAARGLLENTVQRLSLLSETFPFRSALRVILDILNARSV